MKFRFRSKTCMIKLKVISLFLVFFFTQINFVSSQSLKAYLSAGDEAMEEFRYAEAIEYYKKALEFETDDPTISFKMAEASRLYKDYERAAAWYGKIVTGDRENRYPMALFRYAEMKKYLGMYEESGRLYERYTAANPSDTGYFGVKARKESADMKTAIEISNRKIEPEISNAGSPVNTTYSDFGASMMGDTVLYYSSLRFLYEQSDSKNESYFVSRILTSKPAANKNKQPLPLGLLINEASTHNCNVGFSPDYRIMFFTRCGDPETAELKCEMFYSRYENGRWGKPEKVGGGVNAEGFTATHPAVEARGADGYTLYFVSDRPGGEGRLDIWKSDFTADFNFSTPVNAGNVINTFDDEMTPWFDTPNKTLYFSSYGHAGMGGMDIFKTVYENEVPSTPENLGPGYNSTVNDVYYTVNRDGKGGTLSSNRIGSMYIRSKTCCYDIYYYKIPEQDTTPVVIAEVLPAVKDTAPVVEDVKVLSDRNYYDKFLPMEIYFDNDEPDKKSMAVRTKKDYESLYNTYLERLPEYLAEFTANLSGEEKTAAEKKVTEFFETKVTASWLQLNNFCSKLEKALSSGIKIEIEIRGRASPLAKSEYNINLSKRRISSLTNFLQEYNAGILNSYLQDGSLKITEVAAGEMLAQQGVSDVVTDKRNSVYNPDAAVERRIELINIKLEQPGK